jgi:hypothetical protein
VAQFMGYDSVQIIFIEDLEEGFFKRNLESALFSAYRFDGNDQVVPGDHCHSDFVRQPEAFLQIGDDALDSLYLDV